MSLAVIILAAGKGVRMNSRLPKVLHPVLKKPMLLRVVEAARELSPRRICVVVGHGRDAVARTLEGYAAETVVQEPQLGTGHAVSCCGDVLGDFGGDVLILSGDVPSAGAATLRELVDSHSESGADVSFVTASVENPRGYGRIVRDPDGRVLRVVEEKDATGAERELNEINAGIYCARSDFLWESLGMLDSENSQGEYYLPGIVDLCVSSGKKLRAVAADPKEVLGVNTREELAEAERAARRQINRRHMENGVTITDPETAYISEDARIGKDTIIYPNTHVFGKSVIGSGCRVGPSVYVEDSTVGDGVEIRFSSYLVGCEVGDGTVMGPFCHLRPEARVGEGAKIGNFVEIKKSEIGRGSKVPHLSYVGDAEVGEGVNVGAGTITCNYDGRDKHRTVIEDGAFIGSDTMLVAPVKVGAGAVTAAGSTITKDVSPDALAIERAQQKEIEGWAKRAKKKKEKS